MFLWDVRTAQTLRRLGGTQGHMARVNDVCFCGEGDGLIVSGSYDASVRVWDVRSNNAKPVMVLSDARDSVAAVLAGRETGKGGEWEIVSGSLDRKVRFYDVRMGRLEEDEIGTAVTSLKRTRDGKGILVGGQDDTIRLMDRDNGSLLKAYKAEGWKNSEFRLRSALGGNDRWVLCGNEEPTGEDGEVNVWDTLTGETVQRIRVESYKGEQKKKIGRDGKEKVPKNVISCVAWKDNWYNGDQWCCAGTDGIVTVFGPAA